MAKLHRRIRSKDDNGILKAYNEARDDTALMESCKYLVDGLTAQMLVDEYRNTGKYYDVNYPGGMKQFILDYEGGVWDA